MNEISYVKVGKVVVFENPEEIVLQYGGSKYQNARWVVSEDVFKAVVEINGDVKFTAKSK